MRTEMEQRKVNRFKAHPWIIFLSATGFLIFMAMLVNVLTGGPILKLDEWATLQVQGLHTETWTKAVVFLTDLNGVVASMFLFVLFSAFFWYRKWYRDLRFFLLSFIGGTLLFNLFKFSVQRARPDASLFDLATYSFPSGHTTMATVLALSLCFIFIQRIPAGFPRMLFFLFCVLWPVAIAFTRVYLNVHWLSDVIGGLSLGLFWVTLSYLIYPPFERGK